MTKGMENQENFEELQDQSHDDFAAGFAIDEEQPSDEGGQGLEQEPESDPGADEDGQKADPPAREAEPAPTYTPPPVAERPAPQQEEEPAPVEPKTVEIPDHLAEEFAELKRLNPDAAKIALEDSAEGAAVRARLEQHGATIAEDRAIQTLFQRGEGSRRLEEQQQRAREAVRAHNNYFQGTLQREVPDYVALANDPARRTEAVQYQRSLLGWIESKPYSEAAPLMEIAKNGRDPMQVAALIKRFESERKAKAKTPDPTGALAVPARGAPVAPAGIGDKDDFDAGWSLNPSA